jgi:NADP-dependent 3-hydroxy acid dehydrogenase YdfG
LLLDLNLRSHILLTNALLPLLRKSDNPQIVFMSSMAAKSSIAGESVYAATKSGITNFANVLRNELGPEIRVSAVHAWGVDTWGAPKPEEFIRPQDVAEAMEFIISRPATVMVESIELGNPMQWRGGQAPWSPA